MKAGESRFADVWNNDHYRHVRAVLAGADVGDTAGVDTVCDRCHFPKFVQQVYAVHDVKVAAGFHRRFNGIEPALEAGFRLLSRVRYGRLTSALLRRGFFHPLLLLLAGRGDERDMTAYVQFYEEYLLDETGPLGPVRPTSAVVGA